MEIRKYTQPGMGAALRAVRRDFCDDVVIVSSNEIQDSDGNVCLEVIAAGTLRDHAAKSKTAVPRTKTAAASKSHASRMGRRTKTDAAHSSAPAPAKQHPEPEPETSQAQSLAHNRLQGAFEGMQETKRLLSEISSLKDELFSLNRRFSQPVQSEADPFEQALLENGVAREVLDWTRQQTGCRGHDLENALERMIPDSHPIVFNGEAPRIMAFAGPTGVGKTTTLAKIAARFALEENKSVALVTIDTYRTGATEQLTIYARLIGIPLEIASSPAELKQAIGKHLDKQLILIDTAGRSHHNRRQMQELQEFIGQIPGVAVSLVLNASIRYDDLKDVVTSFEPLGIDNCIVTKTDETLKYGNLLNIAVVVEKPIPFITNGQRVPEDIRQTRKADLADAIAGRSALLA